MVNGNKTGRDIAEKIALPVILVISLATAWLVVALRSGIRLSAPIELSRSGLTVSIPEGNGWQCEGNWIYNDNGFTVGSVFVVRGAAGRSYTRCHYLLASLEDTPQERFRNDAEALGGEVVESGQASTGQPAKQPAGKLVVDWARIRGTIGQTSRIPFEIILGVCRLPAGRQLEIEVLTTEDKKDLAQNVFDAIIKGIAFSDNGLLQAGIQIVNEMKETGLAEAASDENRLFSLFLLTDARGRATGFRMEAMAVQTDTEPAIRAASYYYRRGVPLPNEEVGFFRGDSSFDKFAWKVESRSGPIGQGIEMSAEAGLLVSRVNGKENEYVLGKGAMPDIISEQVLKKFLDSSQKAMLIDLIKPDGTISPVYVEKMEPKPAEGYAIRVELLDDQVIQQVYYDSSKKQTKILVSQDGKELYTLTHSTAEEIGKLFPERANLVLNQKRLLNSEGL